MGWRLNSPLGDFAAKPDRLVSENAVPGEIHENLYGLVVVDTVPAAHHVPQAVHCVSPAEGVGLSWVAETGKGILANEMFSLEDGGYLTKQTLFSMFHTGFTYFS